MKTLLDKL